MAINDEVISLTIAISRLKDKNTSSVETNRKRKLQLIDYQEQLSNRSNVISQSKGQYDETILNSTNAKQIHDQSENDVKSLTASIDKIYQEYLEYAQNSEEVEIPQEMVEEHFNLSNTVRLQEFAVEAKKTALSHCAELLRNQDTLYEEAEEEIQRIEPLKEELMAKFKAIEERSLKATKSITSTPCDQLLEEKKVVIHLEKDVEKLEKKYNREQVSYDDEINESQEILNEQLKQLKARHHKLTVLRSSIMNEEEAIDRRINKNDRMTAGTSIASSMANMQQKMAQTLVDNIFKKLQKRLTDADKLNGELAGKEIEYRKENDKRKQEYSQKILTVKQLSEAYDIFERMQADVAAGINDIDILKKTIIDLDYEINKVQRANAICQATQQTINNQQTLSIPRKVDLQAREDQYNGYAAKIEEYKNQVENRQQQIENKEKELNEREENIKAREEEARQLEKKLSALLSQFDTQYYQFTINQVINDKLLYA